MSKCGNNIDSVHLMKYLLDDRDIIIAYCEKCKKRYYFRKYQSRTDPRYGKIFRRDTLQPSSNLYFKEYGQMKVL